MILLDGNYYKVLGKHYEHAPEKFGTTERTITGAVSRVEAGVFENTYTLRLRCTLADLVNLETSFNKTSVTGTPPANLLNFIDEEGFNWNPATGANDATHAYNTGVLFERMGKPEPLSEKGMTSDNFFIVEIFLRVNAKGLNS